MLIFYLGAKMQFENLVLGNLEIILDVMAYPYVPILQCRPLFSGPYRGAKPGCQIDLLLRTKQSLYVFEVRVSAVGSIARSSRKSGRRLIASMASPAFPSGAASSTMVSWTLRSRDIRLF